jgi:hypothetical protein
MPQESAAAEPQLPVMEQVNQTPFRVAPLFWEDLEGRPKLSVIVKATFSVRENRSAALAPEQVPVFAQDVHHGDDPKASVRFESDLVPFKPRADVVLVGKAHAPGGGPATQVDVSLTVGRLHRTIRVFGDRKWRFGSRISLVPSVTPPEPFVSMDLVYERAFGGMDKAAAQYCKENLAGTGFIGSLAYDSVHDKALPNLEDPADLIRAPRARPKPMGFGFYPRGGMPRLAHAGTYDDRYRKERAPLLPQDFSYAFFNGAHPDLQVEGYLRGDEEVVLENLSPRARLHFRLPGVRPQVAVSKWAVRPEEWARQHAGAEQDGSVQKLPVDEESVAMALDTLVLLPDENQFYEVFRGVCPLTALDAAQVARIRVTL